MTDKETILDTFQKAGKALKSGEVAEATGLDKKVVSKIIKELKADGSIVSPKNCYYEASK